jgi:hypothetical protein
MHWTPEDEKAAQAEKTARENGAIRTWHVTNGKTTANETKVFSIAYYTLEAAMHNAFLFGGHICVMIDGVLAEYRPEYSHRN